MHSVRLCRLLPRKGPALVSPHWVVSQSFFFPGFSGAQSTWRGASAVQSRILTRSLLQPHLEGPPGLKVERPLRRPPGSPHSCCHMAFPKLYFSPPLFPHHFFALHFGGSPSTQAESIGRSCGHRTWYCASLPLPPSPMAGPLCGARVD